MGNFISDNWNAFKKEGPMGALRTQTFGKDDVGNFKPPTLNEGTQAQSTYKPSDVNLNYNPTSYKGQYDAVGGGNQLSNLEQALGVQAFNGDQFRSAQSAGIDAQIGKQVAANRRANDQAAANSGLGNSGMNRALDQLARAEGDSAGLIAKAQLEGQIAGLQQGENQFRTGSALNIAGQNLQNQQFGAQFGENQAQFGATKDLEAQQLNQTNQYNAAGLNLQADQLNEGQRQYNESAKYGASADKYSMNQVAPQQRKDQRSGAILQAGSNMAGGLTSAAGPILAAAACRIAEATFGIDHPATNRARYRVNLQWPEWAKALYIRHMDKIAAFIKKHPATKLISKPVFLLIGFGAPEMKPNGEVQ
jgi:hypothetical protein